MDIRANKKMLVLRYSPYKKYDFIHEHEKIIDKYGCVWLLKLGKPVPDIALKEILEGDSGLILKAPKKDGGSYYYCHMLSAQNTNVKREMRYPDYYNELMNELYWYSFTGTWIKIKKFILLEPDEIKHLKLVSNNKDLVEVLGQTRTTMLYAYSDNDLILKN